MPFGQRRPPGAASSLNVICASRRFAAMQPLERDRRRLQRFALTREPAHLRPRRATTVDAIAVRPRRLAIHASRLQLEHLSLLRHRRLLLVLDPLRARVAKSLELGRLSSPAR
jgi:hypothetical protein